MNNFFIQHFGPQWLWAIGIWAIPVTLFLVGVVMFVRKKRKPTSPELVAEAQIAFVTASYAIDNVNFGIAHTQLEMCLQHISFADDGPYKDKLRKQAEDLSAMVTVMADAAVAAGDEHEKSQRRKRDA